MAADPLPQNLDEPVVITEVVGRPWRRQIRHNTLIGLPRIGMGSQQPPPPQHAQMVRVDHQRPPAQCAEVQRRRSGLAADAGQALQPRQSLIHRQRAQEVERQSAPGNSDRLQRRFQIPGFDIRERYRLDGFANVRHRCVANPIPSAKVLGEGEQSLLGNRPIGSGADHAKHQLGHRIERPKRFRRAEARPQPPVERRQDPVSVVDR